MMSEEKKKSKKPEKEIIPEYLTFSLAGAEKLKEETNARIPSVEEVAEAKSWVDYNQK